MDWGSDVEIDAAVQGEERKGVEAVMMRKMVGKDTMLRRCLSF